MSNYDYSFAYLHYYLRNSLWGTALSFCSFVFKEENNEHFLLWEAFCHSQLNNFSEAFVLYKEVESRGQYALAALYGMELIYKRNNDFRGINLVDARLKSIKDRKDVNSDCAIHSALLLSHGGAHEEAFALLKSYHDIDQQYADEFVSFDLAKEWITLFSKSPTALLESSLKNIDKLLASAQQNNYCRGVVIETLMAKAAILQRQGKIWLAQEALSKILSSSPRFIPAQLEFVALSMHTSDWDRACDMLTKIVDSEGRGTNNNNNNSINNNASTGSVQAVILKGIFDLVSGATLTVPHLVIDQLQSTLRRKENGNAFIYHLCFHCFLGLLSDSTEDLAALFPFMSSFKDAATDSFFFLTDAAELSRMQGRFKEAHAAYERAVESSGQSAANAMIGLARCSLDLGDVESAQRHLQTYKEHQKNTFDINSLGRESVESLYLDAIITMMQAPNADDVRILCLKKLDEAVEVYRQGLSQTPSGLLFYVFLAPHLVLDISRAYLAIGCANSSPTGSATAVSAAEKACRLLELLLQHYPNNREVPLLFTRAVFMRSGAEEAHHTLVKLTAKHDKEITEVYTLRAELGAALGNWDACRDALERAIAVDFSLKEKWNCHFLYGLTELYNGNFPEALRRLQDAKENALLKSEKTKAPAFSSSNVAVLDVAQINSSFKSCLAEICARGRGSWFSLCSWSINISKLFTALAQCYIRLERPQSALGAFEEGVSILRRTPEKDSLVIAQAVFVSCWDPDEALNILSTVPTSSSYYFAAVKQKADIYRYKKGNNELYIRCFFDYADSNASAEALIALGDVYAQIQDYSNAIQTYERLLRAPDLLSISFPHFSCKNATAKIELKICRCLVESHWYREAVARYTAALERFPDNFSLRAELAELQLLLSDVDGALAVLRKSPLLSTYPKPPPAASGDEDVRISVNRVNTLLTIYKILKRDSTRGKAATEVLSAARTHQLLILSRLSGSAKGISTIPNIVLQQRTIAGNICCELAEQCKRGYESDRAQVLFLEALRHDSSCSRAMCALAWLYLNNGNLDACENQCNSLLRISPSSDAAVLIATQLYSRSGRHEKATELFSRLLAVIPDNATVLASYVQMLRRAGQLANAPAALSAAQAAAQARGGSIDPGIHYAQGLYERYTNNVVEALREFDAGRYPLENPWSIPCTVAMAEIFIFSENRNVWELPTLDIDEDESECGSSSQSCARDLKKRQKQSEKGHGGDARADNLRAARSLIDALPSCYRKMILKGYWYGAYNSKKRLQCALEVFFEALHMYDEDSEDEQNKKKKKLLETVSSSGDTGTAGDDYIPQETSANVPALVGMATVLHMIKHTSKAKGYLKKVAKANYDPNEDDDYERGWLLLAHIYIKQSKYDLAEELLKKAVAANKSCVRAWELMGVVFEHKQTYRDASEAYEKAWKMSSEKDPQIGYKLAFNYMKAKMFVKAIDTANKVLEEHPEYEAIRENILNRARLLLRP